MGSRATAARALFTDSRAKSQSTSPCSSSPLFSLPGSFLVSVWSQLGGGARAAFEQTCREARAWVKAHARKKRTLVMILDPKPESSMRELEFLQHSTWVQRLSLYGDGDVSGFFRAVQGSEQARAALHGLLRIDMEVRAVFAMQMKNRTHAGTHACPEPAYAPAQLLALAINTQTPTLYVPC